MSYFWHPIKLNEIIIYTENMKIENDSEDDIGIRASSHVDRDCHLI